MGRRHTRLRGLDPLADAADRPRARSGDPAARRVTACVLPAHVGALLNFQLQDEPDLNRWQSGVLWADGTPKRSYDSWRNTIAEVNAHAVDCSLFGGAGGAVIPTDEGDAPASLTLTPTPPVSPSGPGARRTRHRAPAGSGRAALAHSGPVRQADTPGDRLAASCTRPLHTSQPCLDRVGTRERARLVHGDDRDRGRHSALAETRQARGGRTDTHRVLAAAAGRRHIPGRRTGARLRPSQHSEVSRALTADSSVLGVRHRRQAFGTTIRQASTTSSRISVRRSRRAARRPSGSACPTASASGTCRARRTSASRSSFGKAKPIIVSSRENARYTMRPTRNFTRSRTSAS